MCLICLIGRQANDKGMTQLTAITVDAVTYPFAKTDTRERLTRAMAEFVLAMHECYNIPIRPGMTEDEARKDLEDTVREGIRQREEQFDMLQRLFFGGTPMTREQAIEEFQKGHQGKNPFDDMDKKEFIN